MKKIAFLTLAFMKRSLLVLLPLLGAFSLLTSCGSDDDEPKPEWSFLYGEWMPAGHAKCRITMDGKSIKESVLGFLPSDVRLNFSPSGNVSVSGISKTIDLPWKEANYTYSVKKDGDGNDILMFSGREGRFWYNEEEDALYYSVNTPNLFTEYHYIFKRPTAENLNLPILKRDENVELLSVGDMPEWMPRYVEYRESAPYESGKIYTYQNRFYQFKYKGKVYYERHFAHSVSVFSEEEAIESLLYDTYRRYWYTTDWKLVYIYP